jgi:very-short-patch-repair endonuclease
MFPYNKELVPNAKTLRKNMTPEERHLWYDFLKRLPMTVRRQHNIENYIVDFYVAEKKIVIEIDGRQHTSPEHRKADMLRDTALSKWGITVLRYTNIQVNQNFSAVTGDILRHLGLMYDDMP